MSGGVNNEKTLTWNYHWAATIMKSDTDIVTMESYANTPKMTGTWDMYSSGNAEQSFHQEHAKTRMHGKSPVTVGTQSGDGGGLSIASEGDLTEENAVAARPKKKLKKNNNNGSKRR